MDIFDFALKMELDGEKFYRELADKVQYDDLKAALIGLAEDEQRHYDIILAAKNKTLHHINADLSLTKIQNVFNGNPAFLKDDDIVAKLRHEQMDVYRAALAKEHESVKLYRELQEKAATAEGKSICGKLVQEEEKHVEVLEDIIQMLNHVNDWVESAEFNLKEEKY
ncbi:ferritin family protein|uniref:Rubrerythrin n=1 Tax=Dendrosporobacter quercicolus TaxID=146817 RepID=A0A1G9YGQ8_9FIRM|nr:ferritin family protein [Dendrosporobacter quercicolus]NSL47647.1 ferritin family protein [Dendrosporobacter quercicolus DSM 1736]SDN08132.1 Rubrerythrin [Dendrosporobacter quercicolus]